MLPAINSPYVKHLLTFSLSQFVVLRRHVHSKTLSREKNNNANKCTSPNSLIADWADKRDQRTTVRSPHRAGKAGHEATINSKLTPSGTGSPHSQLRSTLRRCWLMATVSGITAVRSGPGGPTSTCTSACHHHRVRKGGRFSS